MSERAACSTCHIALLDHEVSLGKCECCQNIGCTCKGGPGVICPVHNPAPDAGKVRRWEQDDLGSVWEGQWQIYDEDMVPKYNALCDERERLLNEYFELNESWCEMRAENVRLRDKVRLLQTSEHDEIDRLRRERVTVEQAQTEMHQERERLRPVVEAARDECAGHCTLLDGDPCRCELCRAVRELDK